MIIPVVLCGGAGSRLWPLSRRDHPKQLLPLVGERSQLAETLARFDASSAMFAPPMIVTGAALEAAVRDECDRNAKLIIEPAARNTAPAIAAAALIASEAAPHSLVLATPADHFVAQPDGLREAIGSAEPAARDGALVVFGVKPDRAETGFGYIEMGPGDGAVRPVAAFVEKPIRDVAERYLASGRHLWNAGLFLFRADTMIAALDRFAPKVLSAARSALDESQRTHDRIHLSPAFADAPSISLDNAVMERASNVMVAPIDVGWSDLGSWEALWRASERDTDGLSQLGRVVSVDATNCYARTQGPILTLCGVRDLAVVACPDAVLVAPLDQTQNVKALVDEVERIHGPLVTLNRTGTARLRDHVAQLRSWLMERALPLWAGRGVDEHGGFCHHISQAGVPTPDATRRFFVQASQIASFSRAATLGWDGAAEAVVSAAFAHWPRWRAEQGGWPHLLTPDLRVLDDELFASNQAAALLALASVHDATGDTRCADYADQTFTILDAQLSEVERGGRCDTDDPGSPSRRSPSTHLTDALLTWREHTHDERCLHRAGDLVDVFLAQLAEHGCGAFSESRSPGDKLAPAEHEPPINISHQLKWVALLARYETAAKANMRDAIARLVAHAHTFAVNARTGLIMDEIQKDGRPSGATSSCSTQAAALSAALVMRDRGHPQMEDWAADIIEGLLTRYLRVPVPGLWYETLNETGEPQAPPQAANATTLYDLISAVVMCDAMV